jgi:5-methylcytosine-specific restriction endonuclease McrA
MTKTMQVDHVHSLYQGGADEFENMLPSCRSCNHRKGAMSLKQFRAEIEHQLKVLNRDNVTYRNARRFGQVKEVHKPIVFYFEKLEKT